MSVQPRLPGLVTQPNLLQGSRAFFQPKVPGLETQPKLRKHENQQKKKTMKVNPQSPWLSRKWKG